MDSKVKAAFTAVAILFSSLSFAQWSQYPACSKQYESDRAACNKMQGSKAKKESCWASASERLAYCNKTKGTTGTPALLNK
ncbi:hypothetical protein [Neisseria dentiae]|uniref:hypothetical protein n=1 Tax=Neisseria dentiae TaxID=194197 RepID=UPI00211CA87B|nr:hypothetical protein [Neisseria dentiae]MCQ9326917.1 hypothetical protein [Neisseria dentiae]